MAPMMFFFIAHGLRRRSTSRTCAKVPKSSSRCGPAKKGRKHSTCDCARQAVEKGVFNSLRPSLLSLPRRERRLGTKPVFTQGVESLPIALLGFPGFFNTLL